MNHDLNPIKNLKNVETYSLEKAPFKPETTGPEEWSKLPVGWYRSCAIKN